MRSRVEAKNDRQCLLDGLQGARRRVAHVPQQARAGYRPDRVRHGDTGALHTAIARYECRAESGSLCRRADWYHDEQVATAARL